MDPITLMGGLSIVRPNMEESFVLMISVREHKEKFKLLSPSYIFPLWEWRWGGGLYFLSPLVAHPVDKKINQTFFLRNKQ